MNMLLVPDILVVEFVRRYPLFHALAKQHLIKNQTSSTNLFVMRCPQQVDKIPLEVITEVVDVFLWILADNLKIPDVALALHMALESVGVATLFLAGLTPPAQPLQPL
jgi:hypothetical protein